MSLTPGKDLSHYRLVEKIGEGGMGVVWKATDTTLGREVAIKVLPEAVASDPERMARFEREARVLASLNHPGVAAVYGVGSADGVRFLAMEMVEGEDLAARLSQGPMPVVEALETARQIAEALEAAHEKGIVHRDLKPANVKLTEDGQVKVLDFGLAKAVAVESRGSGPTSTPTILPTVTSGGTAMGVILGTAAYMSPEQARGKVVDRRTDIWALGCVLYECLTGKRAFDGETASDTLAKVLEREPSFAAIPAATPPRVRELLQRCLTKDPKLRLRDIGDARITLDEVLASRTPSGSLPAVEAVVAMTAASRRVSPLVLAAIGVLGLVLGASAWGLLVPHTGGGGGGTRCVSITMPAELSVPSLGAYSITGDGRAIVVRAQPKNPDGTNAGLPRLYTRSLDGYELRELPGTEGVTGFLTLRGESVVFFAPVAPGAPQFRALRVPVDGSAPPTAVVDADPSWTWTSEDLNGDLLAIRNFNEFLRYPRGGGTPSAPVRLDAGRSGVSRYELGTSLPGSGGVLTNVVVYDARGWHYSVGVIDPSSGKVKIVEEDGGTPIYSSTGHLLFTRGSTLLAMPFDPATATPRGAAVAVWSGLSTAYAFVPAYFELSGDGGLLYRPGQAGGNRRMAFAGPSGRVEPWDGEPRALDSGAEPSPDGRRFACSIVNGRGIDEIWVSDLDRPNYRRISDQPNADCTWAQWSPDGRQLAYWRRGRDGKDGVWVQSVDGGEARRIYAPRSDQEVPIPHSWLPDGTALLVAVIAPGKASLALVTVAGDEADPKRVKTLATNDIYLDQPRISPEGRRLAYMSGENGKRQVFVAELRPDRTLGHPVQVRTEEGREPHWSKDGKWLFVRDERDRVMRVAVGTAPDLTLSTPEMALDLQGSRASLWSVLPDGRFFLGLRSEDETDVTDLSLVLGWTDELKRKLGAVR